MAKIAMLIQWQAGRLKSVDIAGYLQACADCGCCSRVCPAGLDLARIFRLGRSLTSQSPSQYRRIGKMLYLRWPRLFDFLQPGLALAQRYGAKAGLPASGAAAKIGSNFPPLAFLPPTFRTGKKSPRVVLFAGCAVRRSLPEIARAAVGALRKLDFEVLLPAGLQCCGGNCDPESDLANKMLEANLKNLAGIEFEYLLTLCPHCYRRIAQEWPSERSGKLRQIANEIAAKCQDAISFLLANGSGFNTQAKICLHQPCHQDAGVQEAISAGLSASVVARDESCCGNRLRKRMGTKKFCRSILASHAELIVSSCPHCLLAISSDMKKAYVKSAIVHPVQLLQK